MRYNTSSSQSQYNYPEYNTPQKRHTPTIGNDLNSNPYPIPNNPFLAMMMQQAQNPQPQQQMDMMSMMQMLGMFRMPQAVNFDSHLS